MTDSIKILWPDGPRYVSAQTVIGWAQDEHADSGEDEESKPVSLADAIEWLTDSGSVTFGREVA